MPNRKPQLDNFRQFLLRSLNQLICLRISYVLKACIANNYNVFRNLLSTFTNKLTSISLPNRWIVFGELYTVAIASFQRNFALKILNISAPVAPSYAGEGSLPA